MGNKQSTLQRNTDNTSQNLICVRQESGVFIPNYRQSPFTEYSMSQTFISARFKMTAANVQPHSNITLQQGLSRLRPYLGTWTMHQLRIHEQDPDIPGSSGTMKFNVDNLVHSR